MIKTKNSAQRTWIRALRRFVILRCKKAAQSLRLQVQIKSNAVSQAACTPWETILILQIYEKRRKIH